MTAPDTIDTTATTPATGFEGVFSLLLTPFEPDGAIDWDAYERYVDWQLAKRPHGLFGVCGSSEMKWLTLDERIRLARVAAERAGDVPVVVSANIEADHRVHIDEAKQMAETGVTGLVLVPPTGVSRDIKTWARYVLEIVDAVALPVFLYEWPLQPDYLIPPDLVRTVARRVAGIKDTTCTMEGIAAKIAAAGETIVYQANTPYMLESLRHGARGIMAITSAGFAEIPLALWNAFRDGDGDRAAQAHLDAVVLDSFLRWSYPATAKYIAQRRGAGIALTTRWPGDLPAEGVKAIDVWLDAIGDRYA